MYKKTAKFVVLDFETKSIRMKRLNFVFLIFLLSVSLFGQEKEKKSKRNTEVGLNITNTLAGFFNSGGSGLSKDPYLFSLKFGSSKGAARFATNFNTQSRSEFLINGTRNIEESAFFVRGGYEFRKPIDKRFTIYYGIDGTVEYQFEKVDFSSFGSGSIITENNTFGVGGGPVLGIQFQLMKRIALTTEASIYGVVNNRKESLDEGRGSPPVDNNSTGFKIAPLIPSSLYLIMIF